MDTNLSRTVEADSQGEYRLELLPTGHYQVQVDAPGFQKFVQSGIVLTLDQTALINATLQIGNVNQTVSVTSAPPMVNTNDSTIGRTVGNAEITTLTIVNRNAYTLLSLTPGVRSSTNGIVLAYPQQITIINGGICPYFANICGGTDRAFIALPMLFMHSKNLFSVQMEIQSTWTR